MLLSASPPVVSKAVSFLNPLVSELAKDPNQVRIKKLLLYTCTGIWENNPQRLERAPLEALLQHLLESFPTFEQLQYQLHQVVASLNKSAEYTIIANALISRLHAVYTKLEQDLPTANQTFYTAVTQRLQQEPDPTRIKKLMLLACRSTWENNLNQLERLNLMDLVQELHQINPGIENLKASLIQVAKALSKPEEYTKIAETIGSAFQAVALADVALADQTEPLAESPTAITTWEPIVENILGENLPGENIQATSVLGSSKNAAALRTDAILPQVALPETVAETVADGYSPRLEALKLSHQHPQPPSVQPRRAARSNPLAQPSPESSKSPAKIQTIVPIQTIDFFDLRLAIMQDANPLKAKILLFSLLHELFQGTSEHNAFLRTHELDDLLKVLFLSYRLYTDAEIQLQQTAQSLSASEYLQVAGAILSAIRPLYSAEVPSPLLSCREPLIQAAGEITNMKADNHEVTVPDF